MEQFHEGLYRRLSAYVRALGWWHAIPQPSHDKTRPGKTAVVQRLNRVQIAHEGGAKPDLPPLPATLQQIVGLLFDVGPVSNGGQGAVPLTWLDLQAWQSATGLCLPPWQLRLLRRLSADYLMELNRGASVDAPPPWERDLTPDRRKRVAKHIKNIFRG